MKISMIFILYIATITSSSAHHGIDGDVDPSKLITLNGTITKIDWVNPHVLIYMSVIGSNSSQSQWVIEGDSPNLLLRRGIKRNTLTEMSSADFEVYPASSTPCSTACYGYGLSFTSPTGNTFILHATLSNSLDELRL